MKLTTMNLRVKKSSHVINCIEIDENINYTTILITC